MIRFGAVDTEEDILYSNSNCSLKINAGELAKGTLSMTNREFCWKREDSENGFMIPWDKVTVQAITQEPTRCVYFMIDVSWPDDPASNLNGAANGNHVDENIEEAQDGSEDEGNDSEGSVQELTEFHIVPDAADAVDEIYYIMSKFPAAAPMDDESDDDDFFDGENIENMNIREDDDDDLRFADAE